MIKAIKKIGRGWQASLPRQIAVPSNLEGALYESEDINLKHSVSP